MAAGNRYAQGNKRAFYYRLVITTRLAASAISRSEYEEAEERVIDELEGNKQAVCDFAQLYVPRSSQKRRSLRKGLPKNTESRYSR